MVKIKPEVSEINGKKVYLVPVPGGGTAAFFSLEDAEDFCTLLYFLGQRNELQAEILFNQALAQAAENKKPAQGIDDMVLIFVKLSMAYAAANAFQEILIMAGKLIPMLLLSPPLFQPPKIEKKEVPEPKPIKPKKRPSPGC